MISKKPNPEIKKTPDVRGLLFLNKFSNPLLPVLWEYDTRSWMRR